MDNNENVQPSSMCFAMELPTNSTFLANYPDVCDPPFCFRCGERRAYCKCDAPLSKSDWQDIAVNTTKDDSWRDDD